MRVKNIESLYIVVVVDPWRFVLTNDFRQSTIPLKVPIVLAPLMESVLRWSLMLSSGSPLIFIQRPIVTVLLALVTTFPVLSFFRRRKAEVKEEDLDGDI